MSFFEEILDEVLGRNQEKSKTGDYSALWLRNYQQASFRGQEFFISSATNTVGRRHAVHQFPKRDNPESEDLGRQARKFALNGYIIGENYFDKRNKLIEALEQPGIGRLVHPYLGSFNAILLEPATITETTNEGRICRFSMTFQEQILEELTASTKDTKQDNYEKKQNLFEDLQDQFNEYYEISQKPVQIVQNVLKVLDDALEVLLIVKKTVGSVADFQRELSNVRGKLNQLVYDTNDLFNDILGVITFGTDILSADYTPTAAQARAQYFEMDSFLKSQATPLDPEDPVSVVKNMMYQIALTAKAGLISVVEYESLQDAENLADGSYRDLDSLEEDDNTTDNVISSVRDLRSSINEDTETRTADLGELYTYNVPGTGRPTLTIAYSVYGDLEEEQDVITRNKIQTLSLLQGYRSSGKQWLTIIDPIKEK